jgi:CubicO group peptidase (beta-lactamase class C family)
VSSIALLALSLLATHAPGQDSARGRADSLVLDPSTVEAWADRLVKPALAGSGVPGALVVIVQRSRVILNKGYGLADVAAGVPVNAERTLFNTASIGKSLTAMITAQLLEGSELNLDVDVNRYLTSARVAGPDSVTLRMLLAHRGGFDDDITGLLVPFDSDITIPRAELDRRLRPLVAPGNAMAYDNQGFGVIGLILRDVTRKSIADLFRERLFEPAGMTGAAHGRPPDGTARLARCYTVEGPGAAQECEYWLYRDGFQGAGGIAMSGADLSRYLRLLLNRGTLDGRVVLSPAAFADLIDFDHARFHPGMPGVGLAFVQFEEFRGLEYAHSGHIPGFSSMMKVYPDADVAIYVGFLGGTPGAFDLTVTNVARSLRQIDIQTAARPGFEVLNSLADSFAVRFIPADQPRSSESTVQRAAASALSLDEFLGSYVIATNHSRSFVSRLGGWMGTIRLERAGGTNVRLGGIPDLGEYHVVGPLLYENAKGDRLALAKLPVGRYLAVGLSGGVFQQTNPFESPGWSVLLFLVSVVLMLTAVIQLRRAAPGPLRTLARWGLLGFALVLGGLLAEWQWCMTLAVGQGAIVLPALWRLALHAGVVLLVWQSSAFFRAHETIGRMNRLHGILIAAAGIGVAVAVAFWRVIGAFPPYWSW